MCSSRVTYYAGLAPYDGLRFSDDVAIFPLMPLGVSQSRQHAVLETDWTAEGQHLTGGWLASRAPTQYQMLRSRRSPHQLQIVPQPEGPPRAINRLGTRLLQLMVVDEGGALYRAVDLAAGGETVLQPGDKTADRATMVAALARLAPALTPGIDPADYEQWGTYRNYGWMYNNSGQDDASQSTGLLERGFAGVMTLNMDSLAPRQYIALAERSPEVELGTEVTHEDGSVHLIRGTW